MTDQPHAEFWKIPTSPCSPPRSVKLESPVSQPKSPHSSPVSETPPGIKGQVTAACREVYHALEGGHSEAMYGKALEVEFRQKQLLYETQVHLPVYYKGAWIGYVVPDFILSCPFTGQQVVLELKSVATDVKRYHHQLRKYQQAMPEATILCINFGPEHLSISDFAADESATKPLIVCDA
jgi:GxxExxY protein